LYEILALKTTKPNVTKKAAQFAFVLKTCKSNVNEIDSLCSLPTLVLDIIFVIQVKKMLVFLLVLQYFLIVTGEQYKRDS